MSSIFSLKIKLLHLEPVIWRRFAVSGDLKLNELHEVIQIVMGWVGGHLHDFKIGKQLYECPELDSDFADSEAADEREVRLSDVVKKTGTRFAYVYDFGDDWQHELLVEDISSPEKGIKYPICLEGERSCPPEDCGGPPGYMDFLEAILNPHHEEHANMLEWIGGSFDPEEFDSSLISEELQDLVKNGMRRWDSDLFS